MSRCSPPSRNADARTVAAVVLPNSMIVVNPIIMTIIATFIDSPLSSCRAGVALPHAESRGTSRPLSNAKSKHDARHLPTPSAALVSLVSVAFHKAKQTGWHWDNER